MPHGAKYNKLDDIEKQRIRDYRTVFLSQKGKEVLLDMIRRNQVMECVDIDQTHPQGLAYREGQRRVLIEVLDTINKDIFEIKQEITENERAVYSEH